MAPGWEGTSDSGIETVQKLHDNEGGEALPVNKLTLNNLETEVHFLMIVIGEYIDQKALRFLFSGIAAYLHVLASPAIACVPCSKGTFDSSCPEPEANKKYCGVCLGLSLVCSFSSSRAQGRIQS